MPESSGALGGVAFFWIVLIASQAIICAALSAYVAKEKGYQAEVWFALGFVFGFFALVAAAGLPAKQSGLLAASERHGSTEWECPQCKSLNSGNIFECKECGFKLK